MSKLVLRFYSMSSAFQKKYLTASKTPYIFFYSTRSFMFSLVFATTHFYDAFKFMTALNKTSFKNIFAFCLLIGQLNNSFTYSRLLFTLSLHNSLDVLKDITTLVCDLFGWSCFFLTCIGDRSLNNNNTGLC